MSSRERRPLFQETYVAITRKGHPSAGRALTPQAFTRLEHIIAHGVMTAR